MPQLVFRTLARRALLTHCLPYSTSCPLVERCFGGAHGIPAARGQLGQIGTPPDCCTTLPPPLGLRRYQLGVTGVNLGAVLRFLL